ncbi:putative dehydrogenase [Psychromicrobium silvestre]|uniref:Putative dehydrogenase n=1 Tax=Psychromicrobium silvestre TaxID=1645614 RepID=A0A7Y9LV35_9MICC|nr:Gfo/Idh/MocA family oxidoreductase [Psychromicrobium silvestre]NYE96163.1 putative dehydrogenase [Psychromicrobium silvestre]
MSIRVALVGCGSIGRTHAAVILEQPELELVALVDPVPQARDSLVTFLAGRAEPALFDSIEQALATPDGDADLFVLATPSGLHISGALEVLEAGKHVVIEKPLDVDLRQAQQIEAAALRAEQNGQLATVISQHRFDPASQVVAGAVSSGRFGRVTSAIATVSWWRSQGYYDSGDWRGTWAMDGGGALMNQGVHTVDLLLWFLGKPVQITGHTGLLAHQDIEVEDTAAAVISFESGALAVLHATTAAYPGLSASVQLMGSLGSARVDNDKLQYFHTAAEQSEDARMGMQGEWNLAGEELASYPAEVVAVADPTVYPVGHARQYRDFIEAIQQSRPPAVSVSDAVNALACVRAVYLSATLGKAVRFDDVLSGKYNDIEVRVP